MQHDPVIIRRIVPNIYSDDLEKSRQFYVAFLGLELVMDMGWILTFASKEHPLAQISILQNDQKEALDNTSVFLSIEVSDVDEMYALAQRLKYTITYPIADEPWGVRRFFVVDPNGATLNLLAHRK